MTKTLPILAMLALLAMPAQAQQDIDTLYRAAYCVGVLKGEEWYATTPAYEAGLISAEEALCKWFNDCSEHLKRETKKQQWLEELRYKRERYVAYVVARIGMRMDPTVKALVDKGEREEVRDLQSGAWKKMIEDCVEEDFSRHNGDGARTLYNAQQNHECRARRDQGAANTYACVNMPDAHQLHDPHFLVAPSFEPYVKPPPERDLINWGIMTTCGVLVCKKALSPSTQHVQLRQWDGPYARRHASP